jgi:hypothetical protein
MEGEAAKIIETGTKARPTMAIPENHLRDAVQWLAPCFHAAANTIQRMTIAATKTQSDPWFQSRKILPELVPESQDKAPINRAPLHAQIAGLAHLALLLLWIS